MKTQDLFEQPGNTSVSGVMNTIRTIYLGSRPKTNAKLCHAHTAGSIDPTRPNDMIVLFGFGTTVVHSALVSDGKLNDSYQGASSTQLMPNGNLKITLPGGNTDELEPVFSMSVRDFLQSIQDN